MPSRLTKITCLAASILIMSSSVRQSWPQPLPRPNPASPREDARVEREGLPEELVAPFFFGMPFVQPPGADADLAKIVQDIALLRAINRIHLSREKIERLLRILKEWNEQNNSFRERVMAVLLEQRERLLKNDVSEGKLAAASKEMSDLREWHRKVGDDAKAKVMRELGEAQGSAFVSILDDTFARRPRPPMEWRVGSRRPQAAERKGRHRPSVGERRPHREWRGEQPRESLDNEAPREGEQMKPPPGTRGRMGDPRRPHRGRWRQARAPRLHFGATDAVLPRVIELLEEKLKLTSAQHEDTRTNEKNGRR